VNSIVLTCGPPGGGRAKLHMLNNSMVVDCIVPFEGRFGALESKENVLAFM
jgi:hypothetical protein